MNRQNTQEINELRFLLQIGKRNEFKKLPTFMHQRRRDATPVLTFGADEHLRCAPDIRRGFHPREAHTVGGTLRTR